MGPPLCSPGQAHHQYGTHFSGVFFAERNEGNLMNSSSDISYSLPNSTNGFAVDRRSAVVGNAGPPVERRQFGNSHSEMSEEARILGTAIDQYKLLNRRRYVTYEEMLTVIKSLGYQKQS